MWYTEGTMRELKLMMAGACVLLLPMCNQMDGPLPAGMVQATDTKADELMSKAKAALAAGKLSRAAGLLDDIAQGHALAPCAPEARLLLGRIAERRNDPREAFRQYSKIVERYQNSDLYAQALNRQLAMGTAAANGKLRGKVLWMWDVPMESSKVIEWLNSVILYAPYNDMAATACSVLGDYLMREQRYDEAIVIYRRLVENYPDSVYAPSAQLMIAQIWSSSRTRGNQNLVHLDRAREAYEEFYTNYPNHPEAANARKGAVNMKRLLIQQELDVGRYYLDRARDYTAAKFCFENVIRQGEANPEAADQARRLLVETQRRKDADKDITRTY